MTGARPRAGRFESGVPAVRQNGALSRKQNVQIDARLINGVALLDLSGHFVVSPGESEIVPLRSMVTALAAEGHRNVALNLAGLESIDARGLGELVFAQTTLSQRGGSLTLIAAPSKVRRMLAVTRLDAVLQLCDSEAQATRGVRRATAVEAELARLQAV
jgi:anti-anti-sigma factor